MTVPLSAPWLAYAMVGLVVLGALLGWWLSRLLRGARTRTRGRVAAAGEREAEALLVAAGYTIVERQLRTRFDIEVDGASSEVEVRIDLLVRRRGRTMVAEVKTGERAPEPTHPATRRQLLEYALVFGTREVLLVDVPARQIRVVAFAGLLGDRA